MSVHIQDATFGHVHPLGSFSSLEMSNHSYNVFQKLEKDAKISLFVYNNYANVYSTITAV